MQPIRSELLEALASPNSGAGKGERGDMVLGMLTNICAYSYSTPARLGALLSNDDIHEIAHTAP